jgi:hypothetical protein|tara:strand:- start:625 stop:942 length:318 start_codon:yes stop_codon:yes gene_type:complete
MADINFLQGEFGDSYVITILNPDGTNADISTYTQAKLNLVSKDLLTHKFSATCSISSPTVTWTMQQSETQNLDGSYVAQVVLTKSGNEKTTKLMSVKVDKKLLTS